MNDLAGLSVGFLTTTLLVGACAVAALRPPRPREPHPFRLSFMLGYLINEQPFLGLVWLFAGTYSTLATSIGTTSWWVAVALTAIPAAALVALAIRARSARNVLEAALAAVPGIPVPRSRPPWVRILLPALYWRPDVRRLRNRSYGTARAQRLDLYLPRNRPADAPMLLYLHGGGFQMGSKLLGGLPLLHQLAGRGWICASANYRIRTPYPDSLTDAREALAWLREHADELGGDPSRVVIAGGSAGAHLATTIALTDHSVSAAVGFYGYYGPAGRLESGAPASPLDHLAPDAPPTIIVHGALDTLVPARAARAFADRLARVSTAPVVYAELPGTQHNFDFFHSLRYHAITDATQAFVEWATHRPRSACPPLASGRETRPRRTADSAKHATPTMPTHEKGDTPIMTTHRDPTQTTAHESSPAPHRITDRDVYLLVTLEIGVILLWAFWRLLDVELTVRTGTGNSEVSLVAIVLTTTLATLASYLLLWLLRRHGLRTWTITAVTVALLSCAGPLLATTLSSGVALLTFHVFVGVGLIEGVRHLHRVQG